MASRALMASSSEAVGRKDASDTFRFAVALVAEETQLVAWFQQARAGERVQYAGGFTLPQAAPAVALVQAWQREGLVDLVQHRDPADARLWCWLAQRTSKGPKEPRQPRDRSDDVTRLQLRQLLDWLRRLADDAQPLPPRVELAKALTGFKDRRARNRATYLLERLAEQGSIALIRAPLGARHGPQVTILARGRGQGKTTPIRGE